MDNINFSDLMNVSNIEGYILNKYLYNKDLYRNRDRKVRRGILVDNYDDFYIPSTKKIKHKKKGTDIKGRYINTKNIKLINIFFNKIQFYHNIDSGCLHKKKTFLKDYVSALKGARLKQDQGERLNTLVMKEVRVKRRQKGKKGKESSVIKRNFFLSVVYRGVYGRAYVSENVYKNYKIRRKKSVKSKMKKTAVIKKNYRNKMYYGVRKGDVPFRNLDIEWVPPYKIKRRFKDVHVDSKINTIFSLRVKDRDKEKKNKQKFLLENKKKKKLEKKLFLMRKKQERIFLLKSKKQKKNKKRRLLKLYEQIKNSSASCIVKKGDKRIYIRGVK